MTTALTARLDALLLEQAAHAAANAALSAQVAAALSSDSVTRDLAARFDEYCAQSRALARAIADLVKAGVQPSPLKSAEEDTALTRDLVNAATAAGYSLATDSAWTSSFTRQGVLAVSHAGQELRRVTWDIGSGRQPAPTYRKGSRHHLAVVEALAFIEARSPGVFAGY